MARERSFRHRTWIATVALGLVVTGCSSSGSGSSSGGAVTLQFSQWWANELPKGDLAAMVNQFEK